jgi:nucleotide-binding universal stress UspA family protein
VSRSITLPAVDASATACGCSCDVGPGATACEASVSTTARPVHAAGIVVATDAMHDADGAVRVAVALAQRDHVSARLLSVIEPPPPFEPGVAIVTDDAPILAIAREAREEQLRAQRDRTFPAAADWPVEIEIGDRVATIAAGAEGGHAGLILVGLGAHGLSARLRVRETSLRLIRLASVPVLAVPSDAWGVPHSALVGLDFTASSERAARAALDLLGREGTLYLAHVAPRVSVPGSDSRGEPAEGEAALARIRAIEARLAVPRGVRVEHVLLYGEPATELLAFAEERRVQLVAAGNHGRSALGRLMLGSVSTRLVRSAHCWLLVAPPDDAS